jgi:hypothetical protein
LALLMEEVGARRVPQATGGTIHPMTGYRNDGTEPWYTWFPSLIDKGKMGTYSTLARVVYETYKKGDMKLAAVLGQILNNTWDHGEKALLASSPELWATIDRAMDAFIMPIIRYHGGMPDAADVDKKYGDYITKLKKAG